MEELARERAKDPGAKSIVFSQFTQFLDLIEWCLQRNGAGGAGRARGGWGDGPPPPLTDPLFKRDRRAVCQT